MTVQEYVDIVQTDLTLRLYAGQKGRWMCHFDLANIKNDSGDPFLRGEHGNGKTPSGAIKEYFKRIEGKILVVEYGKRRREYGSPTGITYEAEE